MKTIDEGAPELGVIAAEQDPWRVSGHDRRVTAARRRGRELRDRMQCEPTVASVRTLPLMTLVYPARWAFWGTAMVPSPYIVVEHRALLVQFWQAGALKTLLFNPTDIDAIDRVPYYVNERERRPLGARLFVKKRAQVEDLLAPLRIRPEDIDYIAFDHFHLQDLRRTLGTSASEPRFPRAKLLVPDAEWRHFDDLHPIQRAFFLANGKRGVREDRVVSTTADLRLGDGVFLVRTPGHTPGHQTLFLKTDRGVYGISENGVCADNWAPEASRILGVAARARTQELEVLPNLNTPEAGGDQYASMLLEKHVVDRVPNQPELPQMFPSFEATSSALTPGVRPYEHKALKIGPVLLPSRLPRRGVVEHTGLEEPAAHEREEPMPEPMRARPIA